jgi:hypothetical protein
MTIVLNMMKMALSETTFYQLFAKIGKRKLKKQKVRVQKLLFLDLE